VVKYVCDMIQWGVRSSEYSMQSVTLCCTFFVVVSCSVERDRLRERERQARAQMSSQAEREAENLGAPFFGPPVRVSYQPFLFRLKWKF